MASLLSFFLFLLDFDNFLAFVETAIGTNRVRKAHGTAVRAGGQVARLQSIVCAAHVASALRVFSLWMWGHSVFLLIYKSRGGVVLRPYMIYDGSGQIIAGAGRCVKDENALAGDLRMPRLTHFILTLAECEFVIK